MIFPKIRLERRMKINKKPTIDELQAQVDRLESTISGLMNFISFEGDSLSITTKGEISLEALNIKAYAIDEAKIEAGASAEISSSGNTIIKGSMVMIN